MRRARKLSIILFLLGILVLAHEVLILHRPIEFKDFYVPFLKMYPYLSHEAIALLLWVGSLACWLAGRL